jgi:nucleoside-diphosphate-sugar epimerase
MTSDSHVFITGGTGFVGSYILRLLLQKGYTRVTAIRRKNSRMGLVADIQHQIKWVEADLFDYDVLRGQLQTVDAVIHCAAVISFLKQDLKHMLKVNVEGTAHILNTSLENEVKQFLHVSSIAALGRSNDHLKIDETSEFQNTKLDTGYGLSKHLAEMEVWRAGSEGLRVGMVNPAMIMGAGYWDTGTSKLVDTVYNRLKYYPMGSSGFVDVRDVASMSIEMLERDHLNTNMICCGESMPIRDMINMICDGFDMKHPHIRLTPKLRALAWRVEWLRAKFTGSKQLITKETLATSASLFTFDNSKSKRELGFEYIPLSRTIEETCQLYKKSQIENTDFGVMTGK